MWATRPFDLIAARCPGVLLTPQLAPGAQYGMMVKEGRPELLPRERRHGEQLVWQTSAMAANAQVFGDKALGGWGLPEQK